MSRFLKPTFSDHEYTANKAIDMVAECVAYHQAKGRPVSKVFLSNSYYRLFVSGVKLLWERSGTREPFLIDAPLFWRGVPVGEGSSRQTEPITWEYLQMTAPKAMA